MRDFYDSQTVSGVLDFPCGICRLSNGDTAIADAGSETDQGSELIIVNPQGEVEWTWSAGFKFLHSVRELHNGKLILADTNRNRIVEVDRDQGLVFSSDEWNEGTGTLSDGSHLDYPNNVVAVDKDRFMVTDRNNDRFVVVDRRGTVYRSFSRGLKRPHNCEPLAHGGVIIADSDHNCIIEIDINDRIIWKYDRDLNWPRDANRLANGNTLITDSKNNRILEVNRNHEIVWEYKVDYFANFYEAYRLEHGHTLISDQQHKQIIEVDNRGDLVWRFRNFRREAPIHPRLTNAMLKKLDENGRPMDWLLSTRAAEGGGRLVLGADKHGSRIPGLEYDRHGALYLMQTVAVEPGKTYTVGGTVQTIGLEGFAFIQITYLNEMYGWFENIMESPKGRAFSGDTDWMDDSFQITIPEQVTRADVRLLISGKGSAFFTNLRLFY